MSLSEPVAAQFYKKGQKNYCGIESALEVAHISILLCEGGEYDSIGDVPRGLQTRVYTVIRKDYLDRRQPIKL